MAVEIKTMDVKNEEEQSTIEFWGKFAWTLKSSQRVYNQNSHLEKRGDDVYEVTETTDYTKLVFERDKTIPNYDRIAELEQQYLELSKKLPSKRYDDLKSFARYYKGDYRTGGEKALMIVIKIILLALAVITIDVPVLPIVLLVAFIATFFVGSHFKSEAFEKNVADSESKVCKEYRNYVNNVFAFDAVNSELCALV